MILPVGGILVIMVIVLAVVVEMRRRKIHGYKLPPGPFAWPFITNVKMLRELSRKHGGQHKALIELSKRYNSPVFKIKCGKVHTIVVCGTECIQTVLNSEEYDGRPWNYFINLRNMGLKKGITMNDGPDWQNIRAWFVRSMKSIGFAKREMSDFIKDELLIALQKFEVGGVQQIKPIILPTIINVIWTFATNKTFDEEKLQYFIDLMDKRAQAFDMTGGVLSAYPWIRYIAPEYSGYKLIITLNNELKTILMETIEEHKKNFVPGSESDLIDIFLNEMYFGKGPEGGFDEDQLLMILVDVLLAGLNITAVTLEFLFLNILINQDVQNKLHKEIDSVIGTERLPELKDKAKMPYVEAVILESQRLVPVVPIIGPRRVLRDTKLMGYDIPKESFVLMNLYSINSDPNLYPEPNSFKPERFFKDGTRIKDHNLMFFGGGKRQCPGISMAKAALFLIVTGVMQRYKLLPVPGQKPPSLRVKPGIILSPKPYDVLLVPRSKNVADS